MASEEAERPQRGELRTRILSTALLVPVALAAEIVGGLPFAMLVAMVGAIAFWEWTAIVGTVDLAPQRWAGIILIVAGLLAFPLAPREWAVALIVGPTAYFVLLGLVRARLRWLGWGFAYVAIPCAGFIMLRQAEPFGWAAILFVLVVVWATDIGAYFGGRSVGGPKLWPRVSPKKTWSGAVAGLAAGVAAGSIAALLTKAGDARLGLTLAAPLSIAAQAGDLFESAVKRRFGVKDSGTIIPGHGGILDRVDGLFGAAALAWLIAALGWGGTLLVLPPQGAALGSGS